jgi:putative ATP-binding cassette transporter
LLHAPPWLIIDEAMDTLDDDTLRRVNEAFDKDLPGTGIIHIGRPAAQGHLFRRVLHLVKDTEAHRLAAPVNLGARAVRISRSRHG